MRALPDQDRSVLAAACYSLAIWAEYNPSDSIRVTDQRQEFESCNRVPNLDRFIIARRSDATPIGAPGHAVYAIGMPGQHGRYNPGGHVPNANRCTPDTTWTPSDAGRREGAVTSRALVSDGSFQACGIYETSRFPSGLNAMSPEYPTPTFRASAAVRPLAGSSKRTPAAVPTATVSPSGLNANPCT